MHFYDRILNFLGFPNKTGPYLENEWVERHKKSADYYNSIKQIHPLYRWKSVVISNIDFDKYLKEIEETVGSLCGVLQWELVNVNTFQRNRLRNSGEFFGTLKEEDEDFIIEYSSVMILRRKMDREEFYYFIKKAEEVMMNLSDEIPTEWDRDLD